MADITKCSGEGCKRAERCYRFTAPATPERQSYFDKAPVQPGGLCTWFWDNAGRRQQSLQRGGNHG